MINTDLLYDSGTYNNGTGKVQYIKFNDGTLIQAGEYGQIILNAQAVQNVECKLNVPFINDEYYVVLSKGPDVNHSPYITQNVNGKKTNSITIYNYNNSNQSGVSIKDTNWIAIGKWK